MPSLFYLIFNKQTFLKGEKSMFKFKIRYWDEEKNKGTDNYVELNKEYDNHYDAFHEATNLGRFYHGAEVTLQNGIKLFYVDNDKEETTPEFDKINRLLTIKSLIEERDKFLVDGKVKDYPAYDQFIYELNDRGHIDWLFEQTREALFA